MTISSSISTIKADVATGQLREFAYTNDTAFATLRLLTAFPSALVGNFVEIGLTRQGLRRRSRQRPAVSAKMENGKPVY